MLGHDDLLADDKLIKSTEKWAHAIPQGVIVQIMAIKKKSGTISDNKSVTEKGNYSENYITQIKMR